MLNCPDLIWEHYLLFLYHFQLMKQSLILLSFFLAVLHVNAQKNDIIINKMNSNRALFSYNDKFGELITGRMYDTTTTSRVTGDAPLRITFSKDLDIYPYILFPGDSITVSYPSTGAPIVKAPNLKDLEIYRALDEKYQIIKSPFFNLDYNSKTNFSAILEQITKLYTERLAYVHSQNPTKRYREIYELVVLAQFAHEILTPFYKLDYQSDIIPESYIAKTDSVINDFISVMNKSPFASLSRMFLIRAVKFKGRNETKAILSFINSHFQGDIKNYLLFRTMKEKKEEGISLTDSWEEFAAHCTDEEYIRYFKNIENHNNELSTNPMLRKALLENESGQMETWETMLKNNQGKVLYIDFWASWCKPCIYYFSTTKTLPEKVGKEGFQVIYINIDKDTGTWQSNLIKHHLVGTSGVVLT